MREMEKVTLGNGVSLERPTSAARLIRPIKMFSNRDNLIDHIPPKVKISKKETEINVQTEAQTEIMKAQPVQGPNLAITIVEEEKKTLRGALISLGTGAAFGFGVGLVAYTTINAPIVVSAFFGGINMAKYLLLGVQKRSAVNKSFRYGFTIAGVAGLAMGTTYLWAEIGAAVGLVSAAISYIVNAVKSRSLK